MHRSSGLLSPKLEKFTLASISSKFSIQDTNSIFSFIQIKQVIVSMCIPLNTSGNVHHFICVDHYIISLVRTALGFHIFSPFFYWGICIFLRDVKSSLPTEDTD